MPLLGVGLGEWDTFLISGGDPRRGLCPLASLARCLRRSNAQSVRLAVASCSASGSRVVCRYLSSAHLLASAVSSEARSVGRPATIPSGDFTASAVQKPFCMTVVLFLRSRLGVSSLRVRELSPFCHVGDLAGHPVLRTGSASPKVLFSRIIFGSLPLLALS